MKWEYKRAVYDPTPLTGGWAEGKLRKLGLTEVLNVYESDGWELIAVNNFQDGRTQYPFKRSMDDGSSDVNSSTSAITRSKGQ